MPSHSVIYLNFFDDMMILPVLYDGFQLVESGILLQQSYHVINMTHKLWQYILHNIKIFMFSFPTCKCIFTRKTFTQGNT